MTTDRRINDRQLNAVLGAIAEHHSGGFTEALAIANTAIEASDAKYVPMLVEALKYYTDENNYWNVTDGGKCYEATNADQGDRAREALSKLPPELRGE